MKNLSHQIARACIIVFMFLLTARAAWGQTAPCVPFQESPADYNCGQGKMMTNVFIPGEIGSLINDSGFTCHGPLYQNRMATDSLVVVPGGTYLVDALMDSAYNTVSFTMSAVVWIDFDNDGTFDLSEAVGGQEGSGYTVNPTPAVPPKVLHFNITIPPGVATGSYVMRLHTDHFGGPLPYTDILPCINFQGQVFDYKVRVACAAPPGGYSVSGSGPICAGSTVAFTPSAPGGGWSSSNIFVAEVDPSGNVTGTRFGLDTITYSILDGGGCIAHATQTVSVISYHSEGAYLVSEGVSIQLTNNLPGGTWSSSDPVIASVVPGPGGDTAIVTGGTTLGPVTIYYSAGGCVDSKSMLNTYCMPQYSADPGDMGTSGHYLRSLSFPGEAGTSITDTFIGYLADPLYDRSGITGIVSVLAGNTYNITVTTPVAPPVYEYYTYAFVITGAYQNLAVFVDFANGGIYSPAQVIGGVNTLFSADTGIVTTTFPVTIPAGTAPGTYNMRVRNGWDGAAPTFTEMDGCTDYGAGGAENYRITVLCTAPTISCAGNIITANDAGNCSAVVSAFPAPATTGSPSVITYSPAAGSAFAVGITTVTATATNVCGTATCNFTVAVNDTEKPAITPPADITVSGCAPVTVSLGNPTKSDNCAILSTTNSWAGGPFPVGNTTVTWTVTDVHGNTNTAVQHVTVSPATLAISPTVNNVSCHGGGNGSIATSVSGGTASYTYHWSTGATSSGIPGLHAGTYSVTVTDAHSCTASQTYTVTQPATGPVASATAGTIACRGGTTTVTVTGSGGTSPYTGAGAITGVNAGAHTFTVTDNNGCTASTAITITQPATALTATAASPTSIACHGGTTTVSVGATGGVSPYTGTGSMTGVTAGTHTYTVTDHLGCTATATINITQPTAVVVTATPGTIACSGGTTSVSVTATGGTSPYTGTGTFTGVSAGAHTYTVTDHKGCTGSAAITVTQPAALSVAATVVNVSCGAAGSITTTISGGTLPYSYSWSNGSHAASLTGLSAGTYTLTLTDAHGCHTTGTYTIGAAAPITITAVVVNANCHGTSTGSICATASGGSPAYSYTWSTGAHTATISGLAAGTYTVTVADARGCSASHAFTVTQPAALAVTAVVTNASCYGCSNGGINATASGGTAPYSYSWNNGSHIAHPVSLAAGTYTLTVTDAHGCTLTGSYTVTQPAKGHSGGRSSGNENENVSTDDIKLYPNPTQDLLNVAIPASHTEAVVTITDIDGKTIETRTISDNDGQPLQFSLGGLPRGIYIVKVVAGDINYVGKVIAQ